ncbi:MAG: hypothetical protein KME31_25465 [Tolypothrix carrinoi HA7290-LM1]|nr:hypothetical protein [Tolypothrix carrinoi HA7290-LM1]
MVIGNNSFPITDSPFPIPHYPCPITHYPLIEVTYEYRYQFTFSVQVR